MQQSLTDINVNGKQFIIEDKFAVHKPSTSANGQILVYDISTNNWIGKNQTEINNIYQNNLSSEAQYVTTIEVGELDYFNVVTYIDGAINLNTINFNLNSQIKKENVFIKFDSNFNKSITLTGTYQLNGDDISTAKAGEIWQLDCTFIFNTCFVTCTKWS